MSCIINSICNRVR